MAVDDGECHARALSVLSKRGTSFLKERRKELLFLGDGPKLLDENLMTALGNWKLTMSTPMGEQTGVLAITGTEGALAATMTGPDGDVQTANDLKQDGQKLSWKMPIKKPIPMTLHFDVTMEGDTLKGKFRPGMFPPSPVSGVRV